jgi:hypothetical protein
MMSSRSIRSGTEKGIAIPGRHYTKNFYVFFSWQRRWSSTGTEPALTGYTAPDRFLHLPQSIRPKLPKMKPKLQKPAPHRPSIRSAQSSFEAMLVMSIAMRKAAIELADPELEEHADALEAEAAKLVAGSGQ